MRCECETEPVEHEFLIEFKTKSCETDGEKYICTLMQWIHDKTGIRILTGSWTRGTSEDKDGPSVPVVESQIKMRVVSDSHNKYEDMDLIHARLQEAYVEFVHEYYPKNKLVHERITNIKINANEI